MKVSVRASNLAPSATLKITGLAKEMQRAGKSVISLSAGEPDFKTPRHICDAAIKAINDGKHGYTMNTGLPELREAIADKLKRDNQLNYDPSEIVCSNGAKQSVGFSMLAVLDPGDEVLIPAPYWVSYPAMAQLAEATPIAINTSFEDEYRLTAELLEENLSDKTRMLVLCSPSNPTGSTYSAEDLEKLAAVLRNYPNVYILSDEIYEYIRFDGPHVSIAQVAPDLKDRIIYVNGFSKGFAMTGWRLGYLAAHPDVVKAVSKIQSQETSAPSTISQEAGIAAYRGPLDEVEHMKAAFKERRDYVVSRLNDIKGIRCFTPGGAFYAFPDISAYLGKTTSDGKKLDSSTALCAHILESSGVAMVPGDAFGEPNGLRLSYATSKDLLAQALDLLEDALSTLN